MDGDEKIDRTDGASTTETIQIVKDGDETGDNHTYHILAKERKETGDAVDGALEKPVLSGLALKLKEHIQTNKKVISPDEIREFDDVKFAEQFLQNENGRGDIEHTFVHGLALVICDLYFKDKDGNFAFVEINRKFWKSVSPENHSILYVLEELGLLIGVKTEYVLEKGMGLSGQQSVKLVYTEDWKPLFNNNVRPSNVWNTVNENKKKKAQRRGFDL